MNHIGHRLSDYGLDLCWGNIIALIKPSNQDLVEKIGMGFENEILKINVNVEMPLTPIACVHFFYLFKIIIINVI